MRWLWKNKIALIYSGAGLIGFGSVSALFALIGLGNVFREIAISALAVGIISILLGTIIFCLQLGVRSTPKKVIAYALAAQGILFISLFFLHASINFYSRLYSIWIELILGGLWMVSIWMAGLLLLIGFVRLLFYSHSSPQS